MLKSLGELWPILLSALTVVVVASSYAEKIKALEIRQDKYEMMQNDIVEIKIKVGRIDERLEHLNTKNKDGK